MKIMVKDKVKVITGRDRGKSGEVVKVLPKTNQVVIEGVNVVKRHTKPSQKQPKGGILEITKPINASKVMALDPASGKPARIGFKLVAKGQKERIFKVSAFTNPKLKTSKTKPKTGKKS